MPPTSASTATAAAQYNHLAAASGANLYGPSSTPKNVSGHSGYGSSSKTYMNAPTPPSATAAPAPAPPPPASIGYLNSLTHIPESDSQLPLKSFLRLAESYRVKGQNQERANAIESAFVSYGIAAKYALERVPSHAEYGEKLTREQRQALERNAERILERLSTLKKAILERQEEYRRRYGEPQFDQPQSSRASASEAAQPQITPRFQLPPLPLPPYPVAPVQSRLQHTDHTSPSQFPPQVKIPPIPGIPLAPVQSRLQPTDHASPSHFQLPPYPVAPFRSRLHPSSHASKSIPKTTGISEDPQQPSVLPKPADRNEHPAYQPEPSSAYRPEPSAYRGKPSSYTLASNMPNVTVNQDEASPYTRTSDDANLPVEMIDQFALQLAMQEQQRLQPPTQLPSQSSVRDSTNAQEISHAEVTIPEHSNIPLQDRMDQYQEVTTSYQMIAASFMLL
ncbi:hypothetical protein CYLTODRAFT_377633 [Cylindrobasidium torrendii FP15055 ss-10]|uniref:USP8 dimerisation domain-containing protein n=1 Tax=Cylindrobasidium torrendii FP15055 ss-10 TaxID=1314674 RepID=A0A0D7B7N1_9AGAR|nr:hypothetical protein CYLTODRAFT_377633 [Cylindrobasidium torrendii FP15055 ss-10]